jgi:hypothetical protein
MMHVTETPTLTSDTNGNERTDSKKGQRQSSPVMRLRMQGR